MLGLDLLPETVLQPDRAELPVRLPENGSTYKDMVEEYERRLVRTALRRTGGVQKRAAELLRMKPTTLHEIIKRLEIQSREPEALKNAQGAGIPRPRPHIRDPDPGRLGSAWTAAPYPFRAFTSAHGTPRFRPPTVGSPARYRTIPSTTVANTFSRPMEKTIAP